MDLKEKKEYLNRYQAAQKRIIGLTHEVEKWQAIGERANSVIGIGGGSNVKQSRVEVAGVNVADIIADIQKDIDAQRTVREEIKQIIGKCWPLRYQEILTMRYVNGMSVADIARQEHKERKTIANMLTSALKKLDI